MPPLSRTLRALGSAADAVWRALATLPTARPGADPRVSTLIAAADEARSRRRLVDALALYRQALARTRYHLGALRGARDIAMELGRWDDAIEPARRAAALAPAAERASEVERLAVVYYELGRGFLRAGRPRDGVAALRNAIRAQPRFLPAAVALGDAHLAAGDPREAQRVWERAADVEPALPLLSRLEDAYRREGSPTRMIARYRAAVERAPENLALAVALGRVYLELEMLDEAAEHFEKLEVLAPDVPAIHAFLGAIFERRGQVREAFAEYRRGLQPLLRFGLPHHCAACNRTVPAWAEQCPGCRRWNTLQT
jgi:tetratricopeptide (TPR) repeat protein